MLLVNTSFVSGRAQVEVESKPSADNSPKVVNGQIPLATAVGKTTIPNLSLLGLGEDLHAIVKGDGGHGLTLMLDVAHSQYDTVLVDSAPVPSPAHVPSCMEDADAVLLVVDHI